MPSGIFWLLEPEARSRMISVLARQLERLRVRLVVNFMHGNVTKPLRGIEWYRIVDRKEDDSIRFSLGCDREPRSVTTMSQHAVFYSWFLLMTWVLKDHIPAFAQQWQTVQEPYLELGPAMWVATRALQPWSKRERK